MRISRCVAEAGVNNRLVVSLGGFPRTSASDAVRQRCARLAARQSKRDGARFLPEPEFVRVNRRHPGSEPLLALAPLLSFFSAWL